MDNLCGIVFRKAYKLLHPRLRSIQDLYTEVQPQPGLIPNVVNQTWKEARLPAVHARSVRQFRKRNRDFTFRFFDDAAMDNYMVTNFHGEPILEVFQSLVVPAAKADVWRYCTLSKEGGVYCDIDSAITVPLRKLISASQTELISFEGALYKNDVLPGEFGRFELFRTEPPASVQERLKHPDHTVLNWLLIFAPGHPVLAEVIRLIVENFSFYRDREFSSVWKAVVHATGPLILTQAVWNVLERDGGQIRQSGIDFDGKGVFKIPGSGDRYVASTHYIEMKNRKIVK